ncbi:phage tail length tape measure family protein [Rhodobacteraceae bacterium M382]|nr:phage tail length tape measure family protein [Rhodobacteraceae bacterium M382]
MAFVVQGEARLDGSSAKAELKSLRSEQDQLKNSAANLNQKTSGAGASTEKLGNAADKAKTKVGGLSVEEQLAAEKAQSLGVQHGLAAGQVGNLTAQFNDIGVMLAAGQNPLQLAIQQGTQITQVIGHMGAAGAVSSLKAAFLRLLTPVNLITIGGIAAGAAMIQWLTSASGEALTFEEALGELTDQLETYRKAAEAAETDTADLRDRFGDAADAARAQLQRIKDLELVKLKATIPVSVEALIDESDLDLNSFQIDDRNELGELFEARWFNGKAHRPVKRLLDEIIDDFRALEDAADLPIDAQIAAVETLLANYRRGAELSGDINVTEAERLLQLEQILQKLYEINAVEKTPENAARQRYSETRVQGEEFLKNARARELKDLQNAHKLRAETLALSNAEAQAARDMLAELQHQGDLRQAINSFGAQSVEVAELRLSAERRAYEAKVEAMGIAEAEKQALMDAWDAANGIASVDMAGNISLAADEADRLAKNLDAARAARMDALTGDNPDFFDPRGESDDAGRILRDRPVPRENRPGYTPPKSRTGKGGSGKALDRERQAIERLIARERERLEILRETDPVMQEMIRHREVLIGATEAERSAIEGLIRERVAETEATERAVEMQDFFKDLARDGISDLLGINGAYADSWDGIAEAIKRAALEAVFFGEGPLADLFGMGGDGIIGVALGALGLADGGYVTGPGGDRSDKVPILGSPGEFMVNAQATRQHRPLLEAINAGLPPEMLSLPRPQMLANGGLVGASGQMIPSAPSFVPAPPTPVTAAGTAQSGAAQQSTVRLEVLASPLLEVRMRETSAEVSVEVVRDFERTQLPGAVQRISDDPLVRG